MEGTEVRPRKRRARAMAWLGSLIPILMGAAYCGISVLSADMLTRSHQRPAPHVRLVNPRLVSPEAQAWSARTEDGLTLRGWYHASASPRHLVVVVHGLRESTMVRPELARDLHERGYDVLCFDFRGHGQSDPSRVSMGRRERADLRAVLAWAKRHGFPADRIGWIGFSMGASTILMEGAENAEFRAAVIDSPFGNLPEILDEQLSLHSNLPACFNPGILTAANVAFGIRTDDLIPIRSARAWKGRPLLLIHGEEDDIVPVHQAYQVAHAAGDSCRAVYLAGVGHVKAYEADPEHYVAAVDAFFREHLQP